MLLLERNGILYVNHESFDEWKKLYTEDKILSELDAVIDGQVSSLGLIRLRKQTFFNPITDDFLPIIQEEKN